jgi:hypothetical protein
MVVSEHGKILRYNHEVHALDKYIKDDSLMTLEVTAFKERLKDVRKREAVEQAVGSPTQSANTPHEKFPRRPGLRPLPSGGLRQLEGNATTPASMAPLEKKAMETSAECLKCHVTGFNQPSGYPNLSTELGSVSCEQCHGFGTLHGDKSFVVKPAAESCTTCHDKKNSPNFDYATYWKKISH